LRTDLFRRPAIVPTMPWKDNVAPLAPQKVFVTRNPIGNPILTWQPGEPAIDGNENTYFAVYRFERAEKPDFQRVDKMIYIGRQNSFTDSTAEKARGYVYHVTSFDRLHNESETSATALIEYGDK
jgi:fibronectin type 3 domain-containing protein